MRDTSKLAADAKANMAGFTFTNLASDARSKDDVTEVWRCQKPDTTHYAFDICITRRGAAVFGDIDGLLFQAGYGMAFLASSSISRLHEKLEPVCKEVDFDPDLFADLVSDCIGDGIEAAGLAVPQAPQQLEGERRLRWWAERGVDAVDTTGAKYSQLSQLQKLREFVGQALGSAENIHEARNFLEAHDGEGGLVGADWRTERLESTTDSLTTRLHMVSLAAKAIVALDLVEQAAPTVPRKAGP